MKDILVLIVATLLFTVAPVLAKQPANVSMKASDWQLRFSPGMPPHPKAFGNGWEFDFPLFDNLETFTSINYVTTNRFPRLLPGQTLSMQFQVVASPDAVFEYALNLAKNPCPRAANTRFYIQNGLANRWWSDTVSADLADGGAILTVTLTPDLWSNTVGLVGTQDTKSFYSTVKNANAIGMTFGGGCFFGHGVWVSSGTASFILQRFEVK
jgi:hypothetical protein